MQSVPGPGARLCATPKQAVPAMPTVWEMDAPPAVNRTTEPMARVWEICAALGTLSVHIPPVSKV